MSASETETIIRINKADSRDGYFTISTSDGYHARRIMASMEGVKDFRCTVLTQGGRAVEWIFRIPNAYQARGLGIRKPRKKVLSSNRSKPAVQNRAA